MKHPIRALALAVCLASLLPTGHATNEPGADHPALSRYPGAVIEHHDFKEFEQAQLILSKPQLRNGEYTADKVLPVEGAVTYIHYEIDKRASALQVFRNYQSALRRSGFKELFVCERPCVNTNLGSLKTLLGARNLYLNGHEDIQYVAAQRGDTYVSLVVNSMSSSTDAWLFVIDKQALDDGRMAITGDTPMAKALASNGRVDVYGFYFDTGKSNLKKGSDKSLGELAQVLKDNPTLAIDVVGHTDNVGSAMANQQLSLDRASAVVSALNLQHGIEVGRLSAQGKGDGQPVASNANEDGRARNRRVEIVVRPSEPGPTAWRSTTASPPTASTPTPTPSGQPPKGKSTIEQVREGANTINDVSRSINAVRGLFGF